MVRGKELPDVPTRAKVCFMFLSHGPQHQTSVHPSHDDSMPENLIFCGTRILNQVNSHFIFPIRVVPDPLFLLLQVQTHDWYKSLQ